MGLAKVYIIKFKLIRECEIIVFISQTELNNYTRGYVREICKFFIDRRVVERRVTVEQTLSCLIVRCECEGRTHRSWHRWRWRSCRPSWRGFCRRRVWRSCRARPAGRRGRPPGALRTARAPRRVCTLRPTPGWPSTGSWLLHKDQAFRIERELEEEEEEDEAVIGCSSDHRAIQGLHEAWHRLSKLNIYNYDSGSNYTQL